ncbi:MAG: MFS transporter [Pseudonocardia sp.]|nr:MFS transporter [Pseudonocardia sp.]
MSDTNGRRHGHNKISVIDREKLRRTVGGTAVGNFMEWYDYGVYGFLATTIAAVFFPAGSSVAILATFAVLAVSFAVRPLGGFILGPLADRIGRKPILIFTVTMMAAATFAIGLLPGYATIGAWAFGLLIAARVVQGFSTGGEYAGAMVYINEHAPDRRRGLWVSPLPVGTLAGYIAGAGLVTLLTAVLSQDALLSWGWRIPFLLAGPIGLVGLYIRLKLEETPVYEEQQEESANGDRERESGGQQLRRTVAGHWRPLLVVVGLVMVVNVVLYTLSGYVPTYLKATLGIDNTQALLIILIVLVILAAAVAPVARLSDRVGRRPVMFVGCAVTLVAAIPAFLLMQVGGNVMIFLGVLLIATMLVCFTSVEPATLPSLFPTDVRAGAVSIGYNASVTLFGGTTPLIVQTLVTTTGNTLVPAFYLMAAAILGAVAVYFCREPAGEPLPDARPVAENEREARDMAAEDRPEGA